MNNINIFGRLLLIPISMCIYFTILGQGSEMINITIFSLIALTLVCTLYDKDRKIITFLLSVLLGIAMATVYLWMFLW